MLNENEVIEQMVAMICNAPTVGDAYDMYRIAAPVLGDYKFVFASQNGAEPGFAVNQNFSAGAAVRSLFRTPKVLVLDKETAHDMLSGRATYPIDYSISLDSNTMSYLKPFLAGRRDKPLPADLQEVFLFIARPDVFIDPVPYFSENASRFSDDRTVESVFATFRAYEVLRTVDEVWLRQKNEVRSTLTDNELSNIAQRNLSEMCVSLLEPATLNALSQRHQYMYAGLLKMAAIQIQAPSSSLDWKMNEFLEFNDKKMGAMGLREIAVANAYFQRGNNRLKFFNKIQKRQDDILLYLKSMAWDLWHLRQLEESMTFRLSKSARYHFPAILTFDKGLIEIMDLYPLKALAYKIGGSLPLPFFDGDFTSFLSFSRDGRTAAIDKYFTVSAAARRADVRTSTKMNLPDTVAELEKEVLSLAAV